MKLKGIQNTQGYITQVIEKILKQRQFVEKPLEHQPKFHVELELNLNWHMMDVDTTFTGSIGKLGHERVQAFWYKLTNCENR